MPTSLKKLASEGKVKKGDLYKVPLKDLQVEPGFNLRHDDEALEEHIESIVATILQGGYVPPLAVRVDDDGKIIVVDGHCRREAYLRAASRGAPIESVPVDAFKGNEVDRVITVLTCAQGKPLTPFEQAMGVKRLRAFGWDNAKIANAIGKTSAYIDNLMTLADSPSHVQHAVKDGLIAAKTAVDLVRKHGDDASSVIDKALDEAKASGKERVTPRMLGPKAPPKKALTSLYQHATQFRSVLPSGVINKVRDPESTGTVEVDVSELRKLVELIDTLEAKAKESPP